MPIHEYTISDEEAVTIERIAETHFCDAKAIEVKPAKLTRHLSAFANADGGELYVGLDEKAGQGFAWRGFSNQEDANGHLQPFEKLFPLGRDFEYMFLRCGSRTGLLLKIEIRKTREIKFSSEDIAYLRRGSQSLPVEGFEAMKRLEYVKGLSSFEDAVLNTPGKVIENSDQVVEFMLEVIPHQNPENWLPKQELIIDDKVTVAGALLFADEPQIYLPKASVKIYRYKTADAVGSRDKLAFQPETVEGPIYKQIKKAVVRTVELTEEIQQMTADGLAKVIYPDETLHEIVTNAVLHRDYSINDDVHIRIFDNRIEVESPGRLPAHITPQNILDERFARNQKLVRLINKFPDAPNKDVGEGLNTAFEAMKQLRLRNPIISERENSVLVDIRHEQLASPEQQIVEATRRKGVINNAVAREVTGIESERKVLKLFQKLVDAGELEQVPGTYKATTSYRVPQNRL